MDCTCDNQTTHASHICQLKASGQHEVLRRVTDQPTVTCRHCGAKANDVQHVCAAHLGSDAPNVEGGHGSVGLEEVGKPHAGTAGDKEPEIPIKQVPGDGICGGY